MSRHGSLYQIDLLSRNILKEVENDIEVWIGVQNRVVTMMLTGMTDYSDIT